VSHFIDTCAAVVGEDALGVTATSASAGGQELPEQFVVSLSYPSGSLATITYATTGHPSVEKERLDVLGRSRSAIITDFRRIQLDGGRPRPTAGKGHLQEVEAFRRAVATGDREAARWGLASMRTTLLAAASTIALGDLSC
jgi:predicted dehydrogenase